MAVALAFASCNSTMDDKDVIDAKHSVGDVPAVAITTAAGGSSAITVNGTVSDPSKCVEVGILISATEDMANATYWPADEVASEFVAVAKKLTPLTNYYIQAYSMTKDNRKTVSEVKRVTTSDPEFGIAQLEGTFSGKTMSAFDGSAYLITAAILIDREDSTKCTVNDLDPYFAGYGYVASEGYNSYEGTIDWDNKTITIEAGQPVGYGTVFITGLDGPDIEAAENLEDLVIEVKNYGAELYIPNCWGVCAEDGFWAAYPGGVTLNKK